MRVSRKICSYCLLVLPNLIFAQLTELTQLPKLVHESSGLGYSNGVLWTHNDSGDQAVLYGLDPATWQVKQRLYPKGAYHQDWEDMDVGADGLLYVADTGNNNFSRKQFNIYTINPNTQETTQNTTVLFTEAPT